MEEGGVLEVWSLDDSIDWAGLLAETAENTLSHIDVVLGGSSGAIGSWLRLDDDGKGWASSFAELASNASLLAGWVSSEGVLTSEHGREGTLLPWVMNNVIWLEGGPGRHEEWWPGELGHDKLLVHGLSDISSIYLIWELISNR